MSTANQLLVAAKALSARLQALRFAAPVEYVLDPLEYAWASYAQYVERYAQGPRQIVFLGMNPGPFGMMQTGVPFGEVAAVRDWMGIQAPIGQPARAHPKRPIEGFGCARSEVSGRRFWAWAQQRWGGPEAFFAQCFVLNWCPLAFLEASGRNFTPDKLPAHEAAPLAALCDAHLLAAIDALAPQWVIGIGGFAERRLRKVLHTRAAVRVGMILHPSPASALANRGWAQQIETQLDALGVTMPSADEGGGSNP
jgi:single-strand selective monofunctional uracil DNA glycosylase